MKAYSHVVLRQMFCDDPDRMRVCWCASVSPAVSLCTDSISGRTADGASVCLLRGWEKKGESWASVNSGHWSFEEKKHKMLQMYYRWTKIWLPPSRQSPSSHSSLMHPLSRLSVSAGAGHPFTNIIPPPQSQTPRLIPKSSIQFCCGWSRLCLASSIPERWWTEERVREKVSIWLLTTMLKQMSWYFGDQWTGNVQFCDHTGTFAACIVMTWNSLLWLKK